MTTAIQVPRRLTTAEVREFILQVVLIELACINEGSFKRGFQLAIDGFRQHGVAGLNGQHYLEEDFFGTSSVDSTDGRREYAGFCHATELILESI